jgi:hypothetical protein
VSLAPLWTPTNRKGQEKQTEHNQEQRGRKTEATRIGKLACVQTSTADCDSQNTTYPKRNPKTIHGVPIGERPVAAAHAKV